MFAAWPAQAAVRVAVADFDYDDSSGEVRQETAEHAKFVTALKADIVKAIADAGGFSTETLRCGAKTCSGDSLDQAEMTRAAKAQDARFIVFGGVHKVSTLIQWGQIEVMDTQTGQTKLSRTVSFRGDDADAWQHAGSYIGQMVVDALK